MQGSITLLGFTLLILSACSSSPEWNNNKKATAIPENEFATIDTETIANTNKFLAQIAACSISEMKAGQLAEKRATLHSVKDFASQITNAQYGVNAAVKQLEQQIHINITALPVNGNEPDPIVFNTTKHKTFDKDFMDAIIINHKKAIELLISATAENIDLDIKVFINDILPQLQVQLVQAETIRNELL